MKKLLTSKLTTILILSIILSFTTSCEPVDVLRYEIEEEEKDEKEAEYGGFTIKDWEVEVDSTIYDLKPVSEIKR